MKDAITLVHLRNEFYRSKFRALLGIYALVILVIVALISVLVYLIKNPTRPVYFPADDVGRLIQEIPLTQPNMSMDEMALWLTEAVEAAYSNDYVNYRAELQNAQKYFTAWGWSQYMKGLVTSNNLKGLLANKYVVTAKVVDTPKFLGQGQLSGAAAWRFQMPLLVTYSYPPYDSASQFQNPIMVTAIIQRRSVLESYNGLGIAQLIAVAYTR